MDREPDFYQNKIRLLSRALILSGILNVGVLAVFSYWIVRERPPTPYCALKPADPSQEQIPLADHRSFRDLITSFRKQSYSKLISNLHNNRLVEDGYTVRDLALSALVAFHHFDIRRALSSEPVQKRFLGWKNPKTDQETILTIYPGLSDLQFELIIAFSKIENWPITAQGAFIRLQNQKKKKRTDPGLMETFFLSPEFLTVELLFRRTETRISREELLDVLLEGTWDSLRQFTDHQRQVNDLSIARRQKFLLDYVDLQSESAAYRLLEIENDFAMKKLDDEQAIALLKLMPKKTPVSEQFALTLLTSSRNRVVRQHAASRLYEYAQEAIPENWNYMVSLKRFAPEKVACIGVESKKITEAGPTSVEKIKSAVSNADKSFISSQKTQASGTSNKEKALKSIALPVPSVSDKKIGKNIVDSNKDKKENRVVRLNPYSDKKPAPVIVNQHKSSVVKSEPIQPTGSIKETKLRYYVVREGDSLWRISRQFQIDLDTLKNYNQLTSNAISPGITLKIPPSP